MIVMRFHQAVHAHEEYRPRFALQCPVPALTHHFSVSRSRDCDPEDLGHFKTLVGLDLEQYPPGGIGVATYGSRGILLDWTQLPEPLKHFEGPVGNPPIKTSIY